MLLTAPVICALVACMTCRVLFPPESTCPSLPMLPVPSPGIDDMCADCPTSLRFNVPQSDRGRLSCLSDDAGRVKPFPPAAPAEVRVRALLMVQRFFAWSL